MRHYATKDVLSMAYFALVYSKLQYGILVWGGTAAMKYLSEIQVDMNKIVRVITLSSRYSPLSPLDTKLKFLKLTKISELELAKFMHQFKTINYRNAFKICSTKLNYAWSQYQTCIIEYIFSTKSEKMYYSKCVGL